MHSDVKLLLFFTIFPLVYSADITINNCTFIANWTAPIDVVEKVEVRSCSTNIAGMMANNEKLRIDADYYDGVQVGDAINGYLYYEKIWTTIEGDYDLRKAMIKIDVPESGTDFCVQQIDIYSRGMHVRPNLPAAGIYWTHPDCSNATYEQCQKTGSKYQIRCDQDITKLKSQQSTWTNSCARFLILIYKNNLIF